MILVGNKCDLEVERVVAKESGVGLARQWNSCAFLETSAKSKINVNEVRQPVNQRGGGKGQPASHGLTPPPFLFVRAQIFYDLVRQINRKTPAPGKSRKRSTCLLL